MYYGFEADALAWRENMRIKRITVGNFKNIAETTLDCSRMIALVSVNNYGKSNLLEAIRFGFDFISGSSKTRTRQMHWRRGIPLSPALMGKDFVFSVEFDEPELGEYRFGRYGYRFAWYNDQNTGARITDETLELRPTESVRYTAYLKRNEGKYRSSKSTTAFRKLSLTNEALAIDAIELSEDVEITKVIRRLKKIGYRICDSLELDDSFMPNPIEFDVENVVLANEDIPRTLALLRNKRPDLYDRYIETIYELFPEFLKIELQTMVVREKASQSSSIKFTETGEYQKEELPEIPYHIRDEIHRIVIESKYLNQPISMEHMSTGTKRIFWLIANAVLSEYRGIHILGIDEIETSIHPKMIRSLLEAVEENLGSASMIVTSHSPYMIQYLKPESIYIGLPNENGVAHFHRIQEGKVKRLLNVTRKIDTSVGEFLFELMSGDDDATKILASYLEVD